MMKLVWRLSLLLIAADLILASKHLKSTQAYSQNVNNAQIYVGDFIGSVARALVDIMKPVSHQPMANHIKHRQHLEANHQQASSIQEQPGMTRYKNAEQFGIKSQVISTDHHLFKRQLSTSNGTFDSNLTQTDPAECSGVGRIGLIKKDQYNCAGVLVTEEQMSSNYTTYVRCQDCGQTQSRIGQPISLNLTMSANCSQICCPVSGMAPASGCVCPVDRYGDKCQNTLPIKCRILQETHNLTCSDPFAPLKLRKELYINPNCTKFSISSSQPVDIGFRLECQQAFPLVDNRADNSTDYNFQYWARNNDTLALTKDPFMFMELLVFNFYKIRDQSMSSVGYVSADNVINGSLLIFQLNMSQILALTDNSRQVNYLAGGRMYLEASVPFGQGLFKVPTYKTFLDFYDLPSFDSTQGRLSSGGIGGVTVAVIVVAASTILGAVCFKRRRQLRRKMKST